MEKSKTSQGTDLQQRATTILAGNLHITDVEVDERFGVPRKTLQNMRVLGKGPKYRKFGSGVRYKVSDVEAWIEGLPSGGAGVPASALRIARNSTEAQ